MANEPVRNPRVDSGSIKFCSKCKSVMIDAAMYDPEGTTPLVMEIEQDNAGIVKKMWACIPCSKKAEQELKHGDI